MTSAATVLQSHQLVGNIAAYQHGIHADMRPLLNAMDLSKLRDRVRDEAEDYRHVLKALLRLDDVLMAWYNEWGYVRIFDLFACSPRMTFRVIAHALWSGNLSMLTLLPFEMLRAVPSYLMGLAACHMDKSVLQYLHDVVGLEVSTPVAMFNAALCGHLDVIRYLYELNNDRDVRLAVVAAARCGHLDAIGFFHAHCASCDLTVAFDSAISGQNLVVAQFILNLAGKDNLDGPCMLLAASKGLMASLEWLHQQGFACTTTAMDRAASNGRLDVVQWLHANRSEGCTELAMHEAAINGHLHVVEWLVLNRHEGCTAATLVETTSNGHWDVVRFLVTNGIGTNSAETALAIALKNPDTPADVVELLAKSVAIKSNGRQRKKRCI